MIPNEEEEERNDKILWSECGKEEEEDVVYTRLPPPLISLLLSFFSFHFITWKRFVGNLLSFVRRERERREVRESSLSASSPWRAGK